MNTPPVVSLRDFIASREPSQQPDIENPVFLYDGDVYIERLPDGRYMLNLYNDSVISTELRKLEAMLYCWCLSDRPDDMRLSDDLAALALSIERFIGLDAFADALLQCLAPHDPDVWPLMDYCDAQELALDVVGGSVRKAAALIDTFRAEVEA